jgi:hypothetical protein
MNKEQTNPQEVEENVVGGAEFSPFDEAVIEKEYRKASYQVDPSLLSRDIDEPVYVAPTIDLGEDPTMSFESDEQLPKEPRKINPEYDTLDDAEKRASAEFIVDFALDSYVGLKMFAGQYAEINQKKVAEFEEQGLNLDIAVPFDSKGNMVAVRDLVEDYNVQIRESFVTPKNWVEQIRPVAIRVAMKHGVGMTDEQMLGFMVATDLIKTGFSAYQMRKTITQTLGDISTYCRTLTKKEEQSLQDVAESGNVVNIREEVEKEVGESAKPPKREKAPKRTARPQRSNRKVVTEPLQPKGDGNFVVNEHSTASIELPSEILDHMNNIPLFDEEPSVNDSAMDFEEYKKSEKEKRSKRKYE